ncbi:unnamed protein product [Chrysoparadoxa australica]
MGGGASSVEKNLARDCEVYGRMKSIIPIEWEGDPRIVEHYMPPTFPITVNIDEKMMELCRSSWALILSGKAEGMKNSMQEGKDGIVLFYDEFFYRLFKRARVFLDVFPDIAKRGEVLMKALGFLLRLSGDNSVIENTKLYYLGRSHRYKPTVRPWMFSVYMTTCLETLMYWLGTDADAQVGKCWTSICSYALIRLLRAYLKERVIHNEYYQNYEIHAVSKIMEQSVYTAQASCRSQVMFSQMADSQHGASEFIPIEDDEPVAAAAQ